MNENLLIPIDRIVTRIFLIRGRKVMLDKDLAVLYGVRTKNLNKAVRRNKERFPEDFMFEISDDELKNLRFQFGTSSWGGARYKPLAFTELGVAMLSSVLRSKRAILVNIEIMRTFSKIRELLTSSRNLRLKIEDMERKYDKNFKMIFDALRRIFAEEEKPKKIMGFTDKS